MHSVLLSGTPHRMHCIDTVARREVRMLMWADCICLRL